MYQLTSSFYRANLEKKRSYRLQAEGTLGANGVTSMMYDCVRLIWVKEPEVKGVTSQGKIPDDLVVQNILFINIAMTHTVLYFPACNQDKHSGETGNISTRSNGIAPGQSFLFGEAKSTEEDYNLK